MIKYKNILFIALAIIFIAGCKKYPDGPLLSLHSKEKRIIGIWSVDYFSIDGYDSTSYLQAQPYSGKYGIHSGIDQGKKLFGYYSKDYPAPNPTPNYNGTGYWMFLNHKESIYIHFKNYFAGACGPFRANDITWDIRRLTGSDLWLKTTFNGKEYFVKFKH